MATRRPSRFSTTHTSVDARSAASNSTPTPKVPVSLAKRLLFPQLSAGSEVPSLLTTDEPQLNAELYDFLALALRGYVHPWWTKITKYDKEFLPEITRVVAVFLRSLEARFALADLPALVCRIIPSLIAQHYVDYRNAASKVGTSYATGGVSTLPQIFHQLQPHMAVSPNGDWDETYIRTATEYVMKSCLPTADWEADVERAIVREIIAKVVLGAAFEKITQPWFIQKVALDLLGPPPTEQPKSRTAPLRRPDPRGGRFSFQSLVVFFLSAVQTFSGLCLTAISLGQRVLHTIRSINSTPLSTSHNIYPNLSRPVVDMMAELLTMRSRAASSSLLSLIGLSIGFGESFIDRAVPYMLYTHVFTTAFITKLVIQSKKVLFPNGYPGPPPIDPTPEEQLIIREQLEARILTLLPSFPAIILFGPPSSRRRTVSDLLDPLNSAACNVHLLMFIFDAILLAVFPEMGIGVRGPVIGEEGALVVGGAIHQGSGDSTYTEEDGDSMTI